MSLRARLLASLLAVIAVAFLGAGLLLVGLVRGALVDRVDQELVSTSSAAALVERLTDLTADDGIAGRRLAILRLDKRGTVTRAFPSGFAASPDPLPELPAYAAGIPDTAYGPIEERASADGSSTYHVRLVKGRLGATIAIAAPLAGVQAATVALVRTLVIVGLLSMAIVALVGWWVIRRGLLPLERIAGTAEAISAGDLSHRAGVPHDGSEVGRLGAAFDSMLDQIEGSFSDQRAALEAKARSEDRLRRFVADASHELRTPLTAIRGYAELYGAGALAERAALDNAMTRIGTESRRMGGLLDDLLLLARLDQGRPLRSDPVNLSRICTDAVADAQALEPGRPLVGVIQPGLSVTGDEDRLRQVIGNLLANARVHTPPATPVEVLLHAASDGLELRVVDHGPGINPAHAPHIFDRFYRADAGRSRERGGTGLGLAIATSIVAALGGRLWHEVTPGGGATFGILLPFTAAPQATPGETDASLPRGGATG